METISSTSVLGMVLNHPLNFGILTLVITYLIIRALMKRHRSNTSEQLDDTFINDRKPK